MLGHLRSMFFTEERHFRSSEPSSSSAVVANEYNRECEYIIVSPYFFWCAVGCAGLNYLGNEASWLLTAILCYYALNNSIDRIYEFQLCDFNASESSEENTDAETELLAHLRDGALSLEQTKPAVVKFRNRYFAYGKSSEELWKFTELDATVFYDINFSSLDKLQKIKICNHITSKKGHLSHSTLFPFTRQTLTQQPYAIAIGILAASCLALISPESILGMDLVKHPIFYFLFYIYACSVAPMLEESIFRGHLTYSIKQYLSNYLASNYAYYLAILCGSAVFALLHLPPTSYFFMIRFIGALVLEGLTAFSDTNSLKPAVAAHAAYNTALSLSYLLAPLIGVYPVFLIMAVAAIGIVIHGSFFQQLPPSDLNASAELSDDVTIPGTSIRP